MSRPDPKAWLKARLEALYTQKDSTDLLDDADIEKTFVSKDRAKISKNGEDVSLDKYKEDFKPGRVKQASVVVHDLREDEETARALENDGGAKPITVKGSLTVSRWLKLRVRAAAGKETRISDFKAELEPTSPNSGDFRIAHLTESVKPGEKHINISPVAHLQGSNSQDKS